MTQDAITSPCVDYSYYSETYNGSIIKTSADFLYNEKKAEVFLHRITFDRIKKLIKVPDIIKDALCAMAETHYQASLKGSDIKSESNDGYSVTYSEKSGQCKMAVDAREYLCNTGLMYKGRSEIYDGEC